MKPALIIMAAGMGSRFGGLKQMTPVDDAGQVILDYSVYDALQAGFEKIICVIKKEIEADFRAQIGDRIAPHCDLRYAFQSLDDLPQGYAVAPQRQKPLGTAHAVYAARQEIDCPFAVINADDFYGRGAFTALHDFLAQDGDEHTHGLVAYELKNTLTENGTVARGICTVDDDNYLLTVTERTAIRGPSDSPAFTLDGGESWTALDAAAPVSLNTWGFRRGFMDAIGEHLIDFLEKDLPLNPEKAEFFLPGVVNSRLAAGTDKVRLLPTDEVWHGVTYRDDLPALQNALRAMQQQGLYPQQLWG